MQAACARIDLTLVTIFCWNIEAVVDYARQFGEEVTTVWSVGALEDNGNDVR